MKHTLRLLGIMLFVACGGNGNEPDGGAGGSAGGGITGGGSAAGGQGGGSSAGGGAGGASAGGEAGGSVAGGDAGGSVAGGEAGGSVAGGTAGGTTLTLSITSSASVSEGNAGTTTSVLQVTISAPATHAISVSYETSDDTAAALVDFTDVSGTLTFAPGMTTLPISLEITGDTLDEIDETFLVTLSAPQGAMLGNASATVTIIDDDVAPALSVTDVAAVESSSLPFEVSLSAPSGKQVTVDYATSDGTAGSTDYSSASGTLTFAPGETSKSVVVTVVPDLLDEPDETLVLGLSMPTNATVTAAIATGTITDDDPLPVISIDDATVTETTTTNTSMRFPVTLSAASGRAVSVNFVTAPGTATAGSDYLAVSGNLTIYPGATSATIDVTVIGDGVAETDETFSLTLTSPTNATIATPPTATGTILNDDGNLPALSINDVTLAEGNSGTSTMFFTVMSSSPAPSTITVNYTTANVTATDTPGVGGTDYVPATGTLVFAPGTSTRVVAIQVIGDVVDEANETFRVNLSAATNATIADATGIGTIADDDATPSVSIAGVTVSESATSATFQAILSAASGRAVSFTYATTDGTATAGGSIASGGQDFASRTGTVAFAPGDTSKTIVVSINADTLNEADETFTLTLSGAVNATIATPSPACTITNDDPVPSLSIADLSKVEGTGGTSTAQVPVTLSAPSGRTVTVSYATGAGPAPVATSGTDYSPQTGTLTFAPGTASRTIDVPLATDSLDEPFELFAVTLSGAVNASIADAQGLVTIVNDDSPLPNISINNAPNVTEAAANNTMTFTVSLSSVTTTAVTANWATSTAGTASAGADFTSANGTLSFAPGETSKTITITILADLLDEPTETVFVNLSGNSANSNLLDAQGQGNIVDNDPTPSISVANVTVVEGNSGTTNAAITFALSAASGQAITVNYATADGTASAGTALGQNDYEAVSGVLTLPAGVLSRTVAVPINGDLFLEPNETFTVALSSPVNATIATSSATVTITNDDAQPSLAILGGSITEGPSGSLQVFAFRVTLSAPAVSAITVSFSTANGTATAGADYSAVTNATVTFPAGTTQVNRAVVIIGDALVEANETFTGNLSNAVGATIGAATATCTITNDD